MVKRRKFPARGKEMFKVLLSNLHEDGMNSIYMIYYKQVFEEYNIAFPLVSGTIKSKPTAPWMSPKLLECIRKKAKYYKLYLQGGVTKVAYTI